MTENPIALMVIGGILLLIGICVAFLGMFINSPFFGWSALIAGGCLLGAGFYKHKQENY